MMASTTSGPLAETVGWAGFYTTTAAFALPSVLLIVYIMRYGPDHARGVSTEEAPDG